MFLNYLKIILRNSSKYRLYPVINIIGLSIGLTIFILIGLYIIDELSYDHFYKNSDRIYRVLDFYEKDSIGENATTTPFPLAKNFESEFPEYVEKTVRFFNFQIPHVFLQYKEQSFYEKRLFFTDSTVFEVFNCNFISGNPENALDSANSVVITKSMAEKYFGKENPIGKVIIYEENINLKVTGIIEDIPSQTHLKFDFLVSFSTLNDILGRRLNSWIWNPCWTYILVKENSDINSFESKFPEFVQNYFNEDYKNNISLRLQKLTDIHLKSFLDYEIENNSNITYIYILLSMIIFILLISISNFINLATAGTLTRAKEVAIKKTFGAGRFNLFFQFLFEAIIFSLISLILALCFSEVLTPYFNTLTGKNIDFRTIFKFKYLILLFLIGIINGILAGIYPSIILSSLNPIKILRQNQFSNFENKFSKNLLIISQFTISIILIICTLVSSQQFVFFGKADLGFKKENVIIIPVCNTPVSDNYEDFKKVLFENSNIENITGITDMLGVTHNTIEFQSDDFGKVIKQAFPGTFVGYDFVETFEIEILAGRDFSRIVPDDNINGVLINESLAKHLGISNYEEAIGKTFRTSIYNEKIIGVIKDFNINSLHRKITPFVVQMPKNLRQSDLFINYLAVKIEKGNETETIEFIEKKWNEVSTIRPFEFTYLSDELENQYKYENKLVSISLILSITSIIIACLGVLGLTSFITVQKTKEIGIRKVLGANPSEILRILLIDFVKMILSSIFLAFPISYFLLNEWLKNFAYPIDLKIWMFLAGALITLILILIIVPYHAIKAAYKNPVEALKYE